MIKRFDRYFGAICLTSVAAAFIGVATLYIVVDFFVNIEQFTREGVSLPTLARQYLYKTPPILYMAMPLIVLLGGMFAVARLLRANEVLPLQVGGVRVSRAFRTFWIVAIGAGMLMLAAQEYWLPELEARAMSSAEIDVRGSSGNDIALRDSNGNVWHLQSYDMLATPPRIEGATIVCLDRQGTFARRIYSPMLVLERGVWRGDYSIDDVSRAGNIDADAQVKDAPLPDGVLLSAGAIARKGVEGSMRPISELGKEVDISPHRADLRIRLYSALTYPLACLSLLMIGVTLAIRLDARNLFLAGALTIAMAFTAFSLAFICEGLAQRDAMNPAVAVFGPALLFLGIGTCSLRWRADGSW